jgi:uncharacterized membrane protein required for colicin V production
MNWITILVLVVWGLTAFWGFRTGFIRMVVPLVVVLVGLAFASRIAEPVGNLFSFLSEDENVQTVVAFIVIFVVLLLIGAWLSSLLRAAIGVIPLAGLGNQMAGAAVGIVIGFVILSGVLTGLQKFPVGNFREDISASPLGTFLADNFDVVTRGVRLIPGDWDQRAEEFREGIQGRVQEFIEKANQMAPGSVFDSGG